MNLTLDDRDTTLYMQMSEFEFYILHFFLRFWILYLFILKDELIVTKVVKRNITISHELLNITANLDG